jgi:predicted dehydrogenase
MKRWRIAGINFDHFHMGDLLRQVFDHPHADIVAICDEHPNRMASAQQAFGLMDTQIFTDLDACIEQSRPDLVILCPAASAHGIWVQKVANHNVHILIEKPFAASLSEADAMVSAMAQHGKELVINWPLVWAPCQQTAHRLIGEGLIGDVTGFHHHGGNRGPLYHGANKIDIEPTAAEKTSSWFYNAALGGGSLLDYMGYGATLGSWHLGGRTPIEVTCTWNIPQGLEVDEHAIAILRYSFGLSKTETRWGTFTDPWTHQTQPQCGFIITGTDGTLSCFDYADSVWVQTRTHPEGFAIPVDATAFPNRNAIEHVIHHLETGAPLIGPLTLEISRLGQRITDTAFKSAQQKRTLPLIS